MKNRAKVHSFPVREASPVLINADRSCVGSENATIAQAQSILYGFDLKFGPITFAQACDVVRWRGTVQ